jgi:membrane associated rhomboid family serine protease
MRLQFSIPPVVKNLLIANFVMWIAMTFLGNRAEIFMIENLALYPVGPKFHSWQLITYMFMNGGLGHIFFNMFALWMFGRTLEYELGSRRFLLYYMVCGIGAGLIQLLVCQLTGTPPYVPTVGASGAVFGLLLAFGMMHPNDMIVLMFPPIPMKAKWFVIIYGAIELFAGIRSSLSLTDNVAHFAHLGGMLWGFALLWWWKKRGKIYY